MAYLSSLKKKKTHTHKKTILSGGMPSLKVRTLVFPVGYPKRFCTGTLRPVQIVLAEAGECSMIWTRLTVLRTRLGKRASGNFPTLDCWTNFNPCNKRSWRFFLLRTRDAVPFIISLLQLARIKFWKILCTYIYMQMMFATIKDQMHKLNRSTEGRKSSKETILRATFFLVKDRLMCFFYLKTRFSNSKSVFFFYFSKNWGRSGHSGDGNEALYCGGLKLKG